MNLLPNTRSESKLTLVLFCALLSRVQSVSLFSPFQQMQNDIQHFMNDSQIQSKSPHPTPKIRPNFTHFNFPLLTKRRNH